MPYINFFGVPIKVRQTRSFRGYKLNAVGHDLVLTHSPNYSIKQIELNLMPKKTEILLLYNKIKRQSVRYIQHAPLWGNDYVVEFKDGDKHIAIDKDRMIMTVFGSFQRDEDIEALFYDFYANALLEEVKTWKDNIESMMKEKCYRLTIRSMKSRWGSCTADTCSIRLNTALAFYDMSCVKAVYAHELNHIQHRNHQKDFYESLLQKYPTYFIADKLLKKQSKEFQQKYQPLPFQL